MMNQAPRMDSGSGRSVPNQITPSPNQGWDEARGPTTDASALLQQLGLPNPNSTVQGQDPRAAATTAPLLQMQLHGMSANYYSYYILLSEKLELEKALGQSHVKIAILQEELAKSNNAASAYKTKAACFEEVIHDQQRQIQQLRAELELATNSVDTVSDDIHRKLKRLSDLGDTMRSMDSQLSQRFTTLEEVNQQQLNNINQQMDGRFNQLAGMLFKMQQNFGFPMMMNEERNEVPTPLNSEGNVPGSDLLNLNHNQIPTTHPVKLEIQSEENDAASDDYYMMRVPQLDYGGLAGNGEGDAANVVETQYNIKVEVEDTTTGGKSKRGRKKGKQSSRPRPLHGVDKLRNSEGLYACFCGDRLSSKFSLKRHIRLRNSKKDLKCPMCKKKFQLEWKLQEHVELAHGKEGAQVEAEGNEVEENKQQGTSSSI